MLSCDPQDEVQSLSPEHDLHQVVTSTTTLHTQTLLSWFLSSSICSQFPLHVTYLPLQASAFISHNFLLSTCLLFSFSLAQEHYPPNSFPGRTLPLTLWYAFLSTSPCSVPSTSLNLSFFGGGHMSKQMCEPFNHTLGGPLTPVSCMNPRTQCVGGSHDLVEEDLSKASWERSDFVYSYICITPNLLMKDFFLLNFQMFNDKVWFLSHGRGEVLCSNRGYGSITQSQSGKVGEIDITGSFRNVFAFCLYHPQPQSQHRLRWTGRLYRKEKQYTE